MKNTSPNPRSNSEQSDIQSSLRKQVFELLEKNHGLYPKTICSILHLNYKNMANTVSQYKKQWRSEYRIRAAHNRLSFHKAHGWVYALKLMDRGLAVGVGWEVTRARNGMIVWNRDRKTLGRLEWFRTGRITIFVDKPATWGRVKQLLANAFTWTGLVKEIDVFELWFRSVELKGAHACLDTGQPLPYAKIDLLKDSLGVVAKIGDVSHPSCLELEFCYPKWAEKNELLFEQLTGLLKQFSGVGGPKPLSNDYST